MLPALVSALVISRKSDSEFRRIASVAVSPDGEQIAVCLMQGYNIGSKEPSTYKRSISLLDSKSLRTQQSVRRDYVFRMDFVPTNFFWNSQCRILFPEGHLFYMDGFQESLMCHEYLIAGDNRGYVSKYRLADGKFVAQVKAQGRVTGLHLKSVMLLIGLWCIVAFAIFVKRKLAEDIIVLSDDVGEFIPTVSDIAKSFSNKMAACCFANPAIG